MLLSPPSPETDTTPASIPRPRTNLRWIICGLLVLATVINYVDRMTLSVLAPDLQHAFKWNKEDFGWVLFAFQLTYALFNPIWGGVLDRFGIRRGYTAAVVWWSIAGIGHAFSQTVFHFGFWRAMLGIGEAGSFPGGIKTLAEWFPQRERATANGWFNAGANVGSMVAPIIVGLTYKQWGWQAAFVVTGVIGFVWAIGWWIFYRPVCEHPLLSQEERAWISQDGPPLETLPRVPWKQLIGERRAWAFILGKAFSDPVWSFFVYWLPQFMADQLHFDTMGRIVAQAVAFLIADVGSVGGGWLSSHLINRGWSVNRARKTVMLVPALAIPWVAIAGFTHNAWLALGLISMALAMHQWWSSNLFTLTSDMFPTQAVGTVVGMGQIGGSLAGMLVMPVVGWVLRHFDNNYQPLFLAAACFYPIAFLAMHFCAPKLDRVKLNYGTA